MKWIGLCGLSGAGKDHAFSLLSEAIPGLRRLALADPLKRILVAMDPYVQADERLSGVLRHRTMEHAKREFPEIRRLLQRLGTEGVRENLGAGVWLDALFASATPGRVHVVTDVRFPNEADAIRKAGGRIVMVRRPGLAEGHASEAGGHASEAQVSGIAADHVFVNDGGAESLRALVEFVREYALS